MEIIKQNSLLITLVHFEKIPHLKLITPVYATQFQQRYQFQNIEVRPSPQNQPVLVFSIGLCGSGKESCAIRRVEIEDRKITVDIEGSTSLAEKLLEEFFEFFREISANVGEIEPIVQSRESTIISKLGFSAIDLIDSRLAAFVNTEVANRATFDKGKAFTNFNNISFRLDYQPTDEKLNDYRISISRKEFSLGLRDGTSVEERIFISKAPVSTDTHIELLKKIEEMYMKK